MRTILHCDMNNFYASVECLYHPDLRGKPLAVVGDAEQRHGIVLAKNYAAKECGVATGNPLWKAKQLCPDIVFVPARHKLYQRFSDMARELYAEYTDRVESYGLDECWLDVTSSVSLFGSGQAIADEIRQRIKSELGLTASAGVSFNKSMAKLGSDLKKPDATTVLPADQLEERVWPLPVSDLLYVGPAAARLLRKYGISTIGALARSEKALLQSLLGKCGVGLWLMANGEDHSPVAPVDAPPLVKSVGNSTTTPHDLVTDRDIRITLYLLCESVAERLRAQSLQCRTVQVSLRGTDLRWIERQQGLPFPSCSSDSLFRAAYGLYRAHGQGQALRSLGVRACGLSAAVWDQCSLYEEVDRDQRLEALEGALDGIRSRFGRDSVRRGIMLEDDALAAVNPQQDHPNIRLGFVGSAG